MADGKRLTPRQALAMEAIWRFLASPNPLFILKGSAGTGKTTLIAKLRRMGYSHSGLWWWVWSTKRGFLPLDIHGHNACQEETSYDKCPLL